MSDRQIRNVDCKGLFIRTMGRRRKNNAENSVKKGSAVKATELHKNLFKDSGIRRAYPITRISYAVVLGGMLVVWKSAWTMLTS